MLAVGPMLRPVLAATAALEVTVLYAATIRPFDAAALRDAVTTAVGRGRGLLDPGDPDGSLKVWHESSYWITDRATSDPPNARWNASAPTSR